MGHKLQEKISHPDASKQDEAGIVRQEPHYFPMHSHEEKERIRQKGEFSELLEYCGELCSIVNNYETTFRELNEENEKLRGEVKSHARTEEKLKRRSSLFGRYPFGEGVERKWWH